ncbi:MAG: hypothetical protein AAF587_04160 [Bacteroidota bacterium]
MQTQYWLELLVPTEKYTKIGRYFGSRPSKQPRSLLQVCRQEFLSEPGAHVIHSMLDQLELQYDRLDDQKIARENIALWVSCHEETGTYELEWDPITLMRMGEEGIKMCVRCGANQWDSLIPTNLLTYPRWVEIEDIWLERTEETHTTIYVSFDDGTLWYANAVSYAQFQGQKEKSRLDGKQLSGGYFWQPHLLLVESCEQEKIEHIVLDLLKKHCFEQVFYSYDPGSESVQAKLQSEVSMIHDEGQHIPLKEILEVAPHEVVHTKNYSKFRPQAVSQSPSNHLNQLLDLLETKFPHLAQYGVHRHDIAISLLNHYEGQACLEFEPALMERLGRNGITFQLFCNLSAREIARTVA